MYILTDNPCDHDNDSEIDTYTELGQSVAAADNIGNGVHTNISDLIPGDRIFSARIFLFSTPIVVVIVVVWGKDM